jgi:hypothetical protein
MRRRRSEDPSWEEAIKLVLREHGGAMRYTDIAAEISARGLKSVANPAASVATTFTRSLSEPGSPFLRIGKGEYALRENLYKAEQATPSEETAPVEEAETGALRAFGMFWQRNFVIWSGQPRLLGRQSEGASDVDFKEQVGVYLLHDRERVIYVGRAADTLFARLKAHTTDRLSGRWDRFSWFGLRPVNENGSLGDPAGAWTHSIVIETLEALLIETLEPPLNRKRGDNFAAAEYLQVLDHDIEKRRLKQAFDDLIATRS